MACSSELCWLIVYSGSGVRGVEDSSEGNSNRGKDIDGVNWWVKKTDFILDLSSNSYSKLNIFFSIRASSTFLIHFILSTDYLATNYCFSWTINDFVLKKIFYSRWGLIDTCCSPIYADYKGML